MTMKRPYWILGLLAGSLAAVWWQQDRTAVALRREIELQREQSRETERIRLANFELSRSQISPTDLERLRADHVAVVRLRSEVDALKKSAESRAHLATTSVAAAPSSDGIDRSDPQVAAALAATAVSENQWKNAGRDAPGAAVETMLWAAANGDIDLMASMFVLEGPAREKAEAMLAAIPPEIRARYGTPEKLVALLTAKDLPVGLRLVGSNGGADNMRLLLRLQNAQGGIKETEIALRRHPEGWRLIVPVGAIEGYAATTARMLAAPP